MPYWMRVFCRKAEAPTPGEILQALSRATLPAQLHPDAEVDLGDAGWEQVALCLSPDCGPLVVDRDVAGRGDLVREEVEEFLKAARSAPRTKASKAIVAHLKETKQVFAFQVPTSSIDPQGWAIAHAVMRFLVARCDGLVQADGEGFYRGNDLVLEVA
jgi:hypothetical protein